MCQVRSRFVLEADIKTISRQMISIVTQVKRDRELKQQADAAKDSAHAAVQAAPPVQAAQPVQGAPPVQAVQPVQGAPSVQAVQPVQAAQPVGTITSSTSMPPTATPAAQQTRVAGTQPSGPPAAAAAVTGPAAVLPLIPPQSTLAGSTSSAQSNGLPVSALVAPVAATLPSVVTVAGQTSTVNTITASVNVAASQQLQATHAKPLPG